MDIFFADPSEVPLPPDEVRIRELNVEPYPDGRRLRVYVEVEPFQKRPNIDLSLLDQDGLELSSVSIIETMTRKLELVMHLRGAAPGACTLQARLYYASLPQPGEPGGVPQAGAGAAPDEPEMQRKVVDTRQVSLQIPA